MPELLILGVAVVIVAFHVWLLIAGDREHQMVDRDDDPPTLNTRNDK